MGFIDSAEKDNNSVRHFGSSSQNSMVANTAQTSKAIAVLADVTKIYGTGDTEVRALNGVSVAINEGEFTVIMGPSGSGKSTLLHILAGLDSCTTGTVTVNNQQITNIKDTKLTVFRRENIGFVFQSFNLIPTLTAADNIILPLRLAGQKVDQQWMSKIVHTLALQDRLTHKPHELSGGQQQRVAVARALVARPAILVADEPTGNLDSTSSLEVLQLLREAVDKLGQTVVMVTHDRHAASYGDRLLVVKDGQIVHDLSHPTYAQVSEVC